MKSLSRPILALVLLVSLGAIPATNAAEKPADTPGLWARWKQSLGYRYNFCALRRFLLAEIKAQPVVDGVSIADFHTWRRWKSVYGGTARACGAWLFWENTDRPGRFFISTTYATEYPQGKPRIHKNVTFTCERISRSKFRVIALQRYDTTDQ